MNPLTLDIFKGCFYTHISKHRQGKHSCFLPLTFNQDPLSSQLAVTAAGRQIKLLLSSPYLTTVQKIHQESAETSRGQCPYSRFEVHHCLASAKAMVQLQKLSSTGRL